MGKGTEREFTDWLEVVPLLKKLAYNSSWESGTQTSRLHNSTQVQLFRFHMMTWLDSSNTFYLPVETLFEQTVNLPLSPTARVKLLFSFKVKLDLNPILSIQDASLILSLSKRPSSC